MTNTVIVFHIVLGVLLGIMILFQGGGSGLGSSWGGGFGASYRSRRGLEKLLVYITSILTVLFFVSSLLVFRFGS